ncbi:Protein CLMP1 [Vitis vinifera]|uniref:Protein CLMP1 n=1 Tax=Vitis vinifera TaxID=29760 RepID=A0A438F489_VITVI|nr:Protein CLMP1 [Vitis vinifera]
MTGIWFTFSELDVSDVQLRVLTEKKKPPESEGLEGEDNGFHSSLGDSVLDTTDTEIERTEKEAPKEKAGVSEDPESKKVEMGDWLFGHALLFRTHVGIDPDAHIDPHEFGMELCSDALEETVTSEEGQSLFDKAAPKFQE